jgi:uncharacterized membrane protein
MNWFDRGKLTNENLTRIFVMILLYVLLGNLNSVSPNPIVPEAIVAVNMIIVVLAGILFGKEAGLLVGLMGTAINSIITGSNFQYAAIIPHLIMGWTAGKLREKNGLIVSSLSIVVGHALNIAAYLLLGFIETADIDTTFWTGIGYEALFGIISIIILAWLYIKIFHKKK